jgi:hypothetical protein
MLAVVMIKDAQRQDPLVGVIGSMLEETVLRNDEHQKQSNLTSFTGKKPPLSPYAFVTRCLHTHMMLLCHHHVHTTLLDASIT